MATDLDPVFDAAGKAFNVDPGILRGIQQTESVGKTSAVSSAGAIGNMQIMPATAAALGIDPRDPVQSIWGAANLMSQNLAATGGNVPDALRMYNAGPDRARWNNPETNAYAGKVAANYRGSTPAAPSQLLAVVAPGTGTPPVDTSAMDAAWGVTPSASSASGTSSTNAPTSTPASDVAAMDRAWGVGSTTQSAPAAATTPQAASQGFFSRLGAGIARGAEDVRDTATAGINYADSHVPALAAIDGAIGRPLAQGQALAGREQQQQSTYNQNYGNSLVAGIGRVVGNALATAPATVATAGAINPLVGGAADAVGGGVVGAGVRLAGAAASSAAQGAAAGAATSSGYGQNPLAAAGTGAEFGAALGAAGNLLGKFVPNTVGNALGGTASPVRAQLADTAVNSYGIPLTAAQVTGDQGARRLSQAATTMGGGNAELATTQQQAFNRAALRTVGVDAPAATQQVMAQAKQQIGQSMDAVLQQAPPIQADQQFVSDLAGIDHSMTGVPESQAKAVGKLIDNTMGAVDQNGTISPELYQTLTKNGSPLATAMGADDSTLSGAAGGIKDALDDAFSRSLAAAGRSDLQDQWQQARFQYKNLKTIEPIVNKSPEGNISPALLQGRVNVQFGNRAYQGAGDLGQLADIGQSFLKPLSSSGTPEQGFGLYNLVEGSRAGTQLLHGDVGGAAATAGAMLARPLIAKASNALVGSPTLGKAIVARSLGQSTPLTNALAAGNVAIPSATIGGAVPALNLIARRQRNALAGP